VYVAAELARGDLWDCIMRAEESNRRVSEAETAFVARSMLKALAFVHQRGIVHGDVKPENVLVCVCVRARMCGRRASCRPHARPSHPRSCQMGALS
jgi:hypothetical protein